MGPTLSRRFLIVGALIVVLHTIILFVVIPAFSSRITPLYNQDRFLDGYDLLADNLATGHGYRFYPETSETLMREPGYPLILAGMQMLFGPTFTAVKVLNVILALITAWLMTRIAGRVSSSPALLIVPPVLFLVHPGVLLAESRGGVEILFTMMVVLLILAVYRAIENNRGIDYVICGVVLGLTVLIRSTPLLFPGFLFVYLIAIHGRTSKAIVFRNIGYIVLTVSAILSPWIVRNYRLTGKFVPTASVLGVSAQTGQYICTHMTRDTQWVSLDRQAAKERERIAEENGYKLLPGYYQTFYSAEDELRFSKDLTKRVLAVYAQSPSLCVKCMAYNVFNFWCAGKTWQSTFMSLLVQSPYLALALAGIIACIKAKRFRSIAPMVLFMVYTMCVYIPILAQARYSVPLVPFVAILAAVALVAFRKRMETSHHSGAATLHQEPQREHSMVLASASGKL